MYTIVTGACGFIGSNLVKGLNELGIVDIIAVDNLTRADKFRNLVDCDIAEYFDKQEFIKRLINSEFNGQVDRIFHLGACSDTTASDGCYVMDNNYRYSMQLLQWCTENAVPLLYASSAATYGNGAVFKEDRAFESPLNVYGYSKYLFDQVVRRRAASFSAQVAGFRFFNVYGPREQHKERMASVAFHHFNQFLTQHKVRLFAGSHGYADGEQHRDFVFVDDVVKVNLWFLEHPEKSGIFNVGSGRAQSFNDVAIAVINACRARAGEAPLPLQEAVRLGMIEYIPFPADLQGKYQAYTQADLSALRAIGYDRPFCSVEEGIEQYAKVLLPALPPFAA